MIDQKSDVNGQYAYQIMRRFDVPEYVKAASSAGLGFEVPEGMALRCYGDPVHQRFPCHTKAATWLSSVYLQASRNSMADNRYREVRDRIFRLGDFHGNRQDLDPAPMKAAGQEEFYLLTVKHPDGTTSRKYSAKNAAEVKAAADYLTKHRSSLPYRMRQEMASNLLARATELGVQFANDRVSALKKQAGQGWCAAADIASALRKRANLARNKEAAEWLEKAAVVCDGAPAQARQSDKLRKLACAIDDLDHDTGMDRLYGDGLERPEDIFFQLDEKVAADYLNAHCVSASGNVYLKQDLAAVRLDDLRDALGSDFARDISDANLWVNTEKLASRLVDLTPSESVLADNILSSAGVRPVARESRPSHWLTSEVIEQLAAVP